MDRDALAHHATQAHTEEQRACARALLEELSPKDRQMNEDFQSPWLDHNTRLIEAEQSRRLWAAIAIVFAVLAAGILIWMIALYALNAVIEATASANLIMRF